MNVPKLRFKDDNGQEFPEWEGKTLGCFFEYLQSGKSKEKDENGSFILYGSTGTIGFCKHFDYQGSHILIARVGANAGYSYEVDGQYGVSDNALVLRLKYPNNQSFFYNLLNYLNLNKLVFGSGQPLITGGLLKTLRVFIPSPSEQTKIANFLTAVDDKIAELTEKVALLQRYKKGAMQQIFSQQLRFKDDNGQDFPEWEEKSLGELVTIRSGYSPSSYVLAASGNYPFLKVEDLNNCFKYQINSREYSQLGKDFIPKNSVIFPKRGAAILNNKVRIVLSPVLIDSNLMALTPHAHKMNCEFLHYKIYQDQLFKLADTSSIPQINNKHILPHIILLPCLSEQTKIANFLSALDEQINTSQQQLDLSKQYKQSLLQQMFI